VIIIKIDRLTYKQMNKGTYEQMDGRPTFEWGKTNIEHKDNLLPHIFKLLLSSLFEASAICAHTNTRTI
jgi:hypothetical protein